MASVQLQSVSTPAAWEAFTDLPWSIYRDDVCWVPPVRIEIKAMFDDTKNPFLRHAHVYPLLAFRGAACVGRIVGIVDDRVLASGLRVASFGFLEMFDDPEVAQALLDAIGEWAAGRGSTHLWGPMNPSMNHEAGLLVDGFDDPPSVMTTYNPPYYARLLENCGLVKAKDLFAFTIDGRSGRFAGPLLAQAGRLAGRANVTYRGLSMRDFDRDVEILRRIYNDAWTGNWGFVPMDADEFHYLARSLKPFIDPRLTILVEVRGEPAGFAFMLPDVNQALIKIRDGRLFPWGQFVLAWHLKGPGRKRTVTRCRIVALGVKRAFRELALGPLLYVECLRRGQAAGYPVGEASWILEDNRPMIRALGHMGAVHTKTYRIYQRSL